MEKEIEQYLSLSKFKVIGFKQVLREMHNKNISGVVVAKNVDRDFLEIIIKGVENYESQATGKIKLMFAPSKEWLGQILKIDVPCGVAAVTLTEVCCGGKRKCAKCKLKSVNQ